MKNVIVDNKMSNEEIDAITASIAKKMAENAWRYHRMPLNELVGFAFSKLIREIKPGSYLVDLDAATASYRLNKLYRKLWSEVKKELGKVGLTNLRTVDEKPDLKSGKGYRYVTHDRLMASPMLLAKSESEETRMKLNGFPRKVKRSSALYLKDNIGTTFKIENQVVLDFIDTMRSQKILLDIPDDVWGRIREDLHEVYGTAEKRYVNGELTTVYKPLTAKQKVMVAAHIDKLKQLNGSTLTTGLSLESRGRVRTYDFNAHGINPMGKSYQRSFFKNVDGEKLIEFDSNQDMYQTFGSVFLNEAMLGNTGAINWMGSKDAHQQWQRVIYDFFGVEISRDQAKVMGTPIGYMASLETGFNRTIDGRDIPSVASTLKEAGVELNDKVYEDLNAYFRKDEFFSVLFMLVDIMRTALVGDNTWFKKWKTPDGAEWFYSKVETGVMVGSGKDSRKVQNKFCIKQGELGMDKDIEFGVWAWNIDPDFKTSAALAAANQSIDAWKQRMVTLAIKEAGGTNIGVHDAYITEARNKKVVIDTLNRCNYRLATEPELYFSILESMVPSGKRKWLRRQLKDLREYSISLGRKVDPKRILKAKAPISED